MSETILYEEKRNSTGIIIILGVITLLMAAYLVAQLVWGPVGSKPAPDWVLAALTLFFLLTTLNFRRISITLTDKAVRVYYGIFGTTLLWEDIASCEKDEKNYFYGWGIRLGRYKRQWVWVYNVIGGPRVVFLTGKGKPKGLIISTKNPDELIRIAGTKAGFSGG